MHANTPKMPEYRAENGVFGRILTENRVFGWICVLTDWYPFGSMFVQIEFLEKWRKYDQHSQ